MLEISPIVSRCWNLPVKVTDNNGDGGRGRGLVARRDIAAGELIFTDFPCVAGPFTLSKPLCLKCLAADVTPERSQKCLGGCNYYVCKDQDGCAGNWHSEEECRILKELGYGTSLLWPSKKPQRIKTLHQIFKNSSKNAINLKIRQL